MKKDKLADQEEIGRYSAVLTQLRIEAGYTSYENFAIDKGLDRKQYWRIENGANMTLKSLIRVLKIHKISLKKFAEKLEALPSK